MVLAIWVVAGQDAKNRRKRPVVYFPNSGRLSLYTFLKCSAFFNQTLCTFFE